jgi:hypothetical protein
LCGKASALDTIGAFIHGKLDDVGAQTAFIAGCQQDSDSIAAYIEGASAPFGSIDAYICGKDTATAGLSAFIEGTLVQRGTLLAYIAGKFVLEITPAPATVRVMALRGWADEVKLSRETRSTATVNQKTYL